MLNQPGSGGPKYSVLATSSSTGRSQMLRVIPISHVVTLFSLFLFLIVMIGFYSFRVSKASQCLGPPYIYLSYSNRGDLMKITRDGCVDMEKVLWNSPSIKYGDLRSMYMGSFRGKSALFVADASSKHSRVMIFGSCSYWNNLRPYLASALSSETEDFGGGAKHTYGVTQDAAGNIYASFQHTDVVLRADKDTLRPMKIPRNASLGIGLHGATSSLRPFPGTFTQFGYPTVHNDTDQGLRSLQWVKNRLWIANEDKKMVYVVDRWGAEVMKIDVHDPIGMYFHTPRNLVFVGSKSNKHGAVFAFNADSFLLVHTYQVMGMSHPTGIVAVEDILFVAEQSLNAVLTFNITSTRFIEEIYKHVSGDLEQLQLSDC